MPHPHLERAGLGDGRLGHVEQVGQRVGVGDRQVVGGQHPDGRAALDGVRELAGQLGQARLHDEAAHEVDAVEAVVAKAADELEQQAPVDAVEQLGRRDGGGGHCRVVALVGLGSAGLGWGEVVALAGDDVADPAPRVGYVAGIAGDHVQVQVLDGLPGGGAGVEAHVVPVWPVAVVEQRLHLVDQVHQVEALVARRLPPGGDETARHDQGMTFTHRVGVSDRERGTVHRQPGGRRDLSEGRRVRGHRK